MIIAVSKRLLLGYVGLVLVLAVLGAHNQALRAERVELMAVKSQLEGRRVELRAQAALVTSPMAVRAWAQGRGMVASTYVSETSQVASLHPPSMAVPETGLEIKTVWR
ncbi:MAG: hypothetical protein M3511_01280 [Deinococcota bacterium]|nr:hypothetical protein [Deinococcota bacterium]